MDDIRERSYQGKKGLIVVAFPLSWGEYQRYVGQKIPSYSDDSEEGYYVQHGPCYHRFWKKNKFEDYYTQID